jgi:3D (Asp-Asp-Asp) domain-containing protein
MSGDQAKRLSIGDMVRAGVDYLADLIARIANGIAGLVPLAALGCSGPKVEPLEQKPAVVVPAQTDDDRTADNGEPKPIGRFNVTFYYVIGEEEVAAAAAKAANDNAGEQTLAAVAATETTTIYEAKTCAPIADVSRDFLAQLRLQGTGKLRDGRVVNIWSQCSCARSPCFKVMAHKAHKWGTGGAGKALQPFRTVAADRRVIKQGSLLYLPMLEGRTMPGRAPWGGFVHDGCVVAEDTGGGINGHQLDLFVGRRSYFYALSGRGGSHGWARNVEVFDGSKICERKGRKIGKRAAAI